MSKLVKTGRLCLILCMLLPELVLAQKDLDFQRMLKPVPRTAVLSDSAYFIWCGTMVQGKDGLFHLYYSRWKKELGFNAWVTHSEVAHATSRKALGPFSFKDVVLPARGA